MVFVFVSMLFFFVQNASNKELGARFKTDTPLLMRFQWVVHAAMLLTLAIMEIPKWSAESAAFNAEAAILAVIYGLAFLATATVLTKALSVGPIGATTLVVNLSLVLSVAASTVFFEESITLTRALGIPCVLVTLVLSAMGGAGGRKGNAVWVVLTLFAFIGDGALSIIQKTFLTLCPGVSSNFFLLVSAVCGWIACTAGCAFTKTDAVKAGNAKLFVALGLVVGVSTVFGTAFTLKALSLLDGVIVFPVRQGSLILAMTLYGILRYRDRFDLKTAAMLLSGIAGIILLNI